MKNFVQSLAKLAASDESAVLDAGVLLTVAMELAASNPAKYGALVAALTKTTDMQGEYALLAPRSARLRSAAFPPPTCQTFRPQAPGTPRASSTPRRAPPTSRRWSAARPTTRERTRA